MKKLCLSLFGLIWFTSAAWGQACPAGSLSLGPLAGTSVATSTLTNWGLPNPPGTLITAPQFNPALGTLSSAIVSATGTASGTATGTGTGGGRGATFTLTLKANVLITGPSGTADLSPIPSTSANFSGVLLGATGTIAGQTGTATVFESVTTGLASYIGLGTVSFGASATGNSSTSITSGTVDTVYQTTAGATVNVIYCYPPPVLTVTKTPLTATVTQGSSGSFTITVGNSNSTATPTSSTIAAQVVDTMPAGLPVGTLTAGNTNGWLCAVTGTVVAGQTITCTITQVVAPGGTYPTITVPYTVPAAFAAGTLTNNVSVSGGGGTTAPTSSANVVVPPPVLSIAKTPLTTTLAQGSVGTFTLTVSNSAGTGSTFGSVTVTDPVPAGLTIGAVTSPGGAWACGVVLQNITCTITQTVAPGGSYPAITVPYTVAAGTAPGTLPNTATQTGGGDPGTHTGTANVVVPPPVLSITKTPLTTTLAQGGAGSFTLTVSNSAVAGTGSTFGVVTVTDPVPAGLTIGAVTSPGGAWACGVVLQNITCTITQTVAPGGTYPAITVPYTVAAGTAPGTLPNTATQTGGGDPGTHTGTANVVVPAPVLSITKTPLTTTLAPGGTGSFTLTVSNSAAAGTGSTFGQVTVTDPVPGGLTIGAVTSPGAAWGCDVVLQNITCTITQTVLPGGSYPAITVPYTVAPGTPPGTLINVATQTGGGDPGTHTGSGNVVVPGAGPALSITKAPASNTVAQGGSGSFTLTVSNGAGSGPTAGQVTVTDPVPAGLTIGAVTSPGGAWACGVIGQNITCTITQVVAGGGSYPAITVPYTVAAGTAPGTLPNTATQTGGGDPGTHTGTANVVVPPPVLSITKTPLTTTLAQGGAGSFTLTVSNSAVAGTGSTFGVVTVTDPVPAGLTIGAVTSPGGAWACGVVLQNITCTITQTVAAGGSYPAITVPYTVAAGTAPGTLPNTATQTGGGDPGTHTGSANVVVPPPVLSITKTPLTTTLAPGGTGSFTLTVSNSAAAGTGSTFGVVTVTDPVPAGLTIGAVTSPGAAWGCDVVLQNITCTITRTVLPGSSYPAITVPYTVAPGTAAGTLTNTATQTGGGDPGTHTGIATVVIPAPAPPVIPTGLPDLTIAKSHIGNFTQGQIGATYTLLISNIQPIATTGTVSVVDTLPAGLTLVSMSGTGWTCTSGLPSCFRNDSLAGSASYPPITVTVNVSATATGTLINTAVVSGGGETNTGNDTATDPVTIAAVPDMTLTKTHAGTSFVPGGSVTFSLTASNIGAGATSGAVTVTDTLPAGLTATAIGGPAPWVCQPLPALSCSRSDSLAPGASYPQITVTASIAANATGTLVNNAVVGGGGEVNLPNDPAADSIIVSGLPDMTIAKSHAGTTFVPGGSVTFTLSPSNVGTAATSGSVSVADTLPAGLTATAINGAAPWVCQPLPALACSRGDSLAPGGSYSPITVTASIAITATGTLVNSATVGGGGEVFLPNDTATDSIPLAGLPDLTLTKTHTGSGFAPGGSVTFTLTANNIGTAPTSGLVTVTDTLPIGLTATAIGGPSPWICQALPALSCSRSDLLAPGASYSAITLTAGIAANAAGTLVNNALVGGGGEVNLPNDPATDSITVSGVPDMTISKTHTGTFTRGAAGTYTIVASNVGGVATSGTVTVTDTLPAGLTATAISGGSTWACTLTPLLCTTSAVLAPGAAYPAIVLTVLVLGTAPSPVINTATVSGGGEVNLTNDVAQDPAPLSGVAPFLTLVKTNSGNFIQGGTAFYTIVLSNTGTGPTAGLVTITDPMPQGLTATSIAGSGWNCSLTSLSCTRSDVLAAGASYSPITITVSIASNAPTNIVNVAQASCDCAGTTSISAQSGAILTTVLSNFVLSKTANQTEAEIGDVVVYTMRVSNNYPDDFTGAQVKDAMPPGFVYISGSAQVTFGGGAPQPITPITTTPGTLIFSLGTVLAKQTDVITYRLQVGGQARIGDSVNSAQGTANPPTGPPGATNISAAIVHIGAKLFSTRQFLIGRVFEDTNGNGDFDPGERPIAGARIYLSNGGSATTDSNGLYNVPVVAAGSVVVALDSATVPKGYTISGGNRVDEQNWSRLVRTPLNQGMMLRQNFGLKPCPYCQSAATATVAGMAPAVSNRPPAKLELIPLQPTLPGDGRASMQVRVRVLDDQGNPTRAKEVRLRTSAGQFVNEGTSSGVGAAAVSPATSGPQIALSGRSTEFQGGRTLEQVPETMQAGMAHDVNGEATFLLLAAHTPGEARLVAESGDPDHLLSAEGSVWFTPEKRSPILVSDGEISIGRAAPEFPILGQSGNVSRRGDAFLQAPLSETSLLTLGYTSHLTLNDSNGNPGLFQMDPLNRIYEVYGDSSTQYQAAQSNAHAYGRLEHNQSYLLFGDLRMTSAPADSAPVPGSSAFAPQQGAPQQISSNVGDYNRNVVGAALHLEDAHHDFLTLEGARPNTSFARDVFRGSTFGLIQLSHVNLVSGSESGVIETRDVHNPEIILSREQLVRSVDYSIDPYTGAVFFLRTLNTYDMALNLNQVVFTYEFENTTGASTLYGLRAQIRADSLGFRLGLGVTQQRDPVAGSYYLGNVILQQHLPMAGRLSIEVPVSHGSALSAGIVSGGTADVNGTAVRADVEQPFNFLSGRFRGSFSKTDTNFFNPFGASVIPGSQTTLGSVELKPVKKTSVRFGVTDERNKTSLVNNQRQTGSFEWKQFLTGTLDLTAGYDYRDFSDAFNSREVKSNEVNAALEWKPFERFTASVRREQNLSASDPTYPNETLLSARYQASETVRLFATERLASAPITPIGDLSSGGFAALAGKNETSIGIEDKWSKYSSVQSKYMVENGINGTDTFAVIGLVNRIPVQEHLRLDLGLERGELLTGKDRSYDAGSVGFSWLPTKNFRTSTRYEIRDLGGLGQIFTTGGAGRLSDGLTVLGRYQHSSAAFQPGTGAVILLNPLSTNPQLSQQTRANQGTAALAWRPWKTDREGLLFSYTLRDATLNGVPASTQAQHDTVGLLSTDGYYQATRRVELYGKFAMSDRTYNYTGAPEVSTFNYLWQARIQTRISRRFDAALEGRTIYQPHTSLRQSTAAVEAGFWATKDLRVGVGYSFKSADEMAADFLTNPVKRGAYFVLSSKLSNLFNLFDPGVTCICAAPPPPPPPPPPPAPKPLANIQISAITGAHDVCPSDELRLQATASGWLPDQTPAYQWYIDGTAVPGATGTSLSMPTARGSGTRSVTVSVTAGGITRTSAPVSVLIKPSGPPSVRFVVSPSTIEYGAKLPLAATGTASECTTPATITYTASEGTVSGNIFDSASVAFDMSATKTQAKVIHLTATATDRIGQKATASGDVTITLTPKPRRLDDVVFTSNSSRVNNCGKRLLLEELTPMLRNDPAAKVILIGHRDVAEKAGSKSGTVDEQRVLNAAAVLSAGQGICPQLDLSRILLNWVGTDQASTPRPALCAASAGVKERAGQTINASDARAEFRRVEIWFVPGGAEMPAGMTGLKAAPEKDIKVLACPK